MKKTGGVSEFAHGRTSSSRDPLYSLVLDDEDVVLLADLEHLELPLDRGRASGRVSSDGDGVDDLRLDGSLGPVVEHLLHRDRVESLRVDGDLVLGALEGVEDGDDTRVGGCLDEDVVSGSDEHLERLGQQVLASSSDRDSPRRVDGLVVDVGGEVGKELVQAGPSGSRSAGREEQANQR